MAIAPPADPRPLAHALAALESFGLLALTSVPAVAAVAAHRATLPPALRVAVVGASTAAAVRALGWRVDRQPDEFHTAGVVARFAGDEQGVAGRRVLFPASDRAATALPDGLAALGAEVVRVEAYRTAPAPLDAGSCRDAAVRGEVDVVTFASPSAVDGLAAALGDAGLTQLLAEAAVAARQAGLGVARADRWPQLAAASDFGLVDYAARSAHLRFAERKLPCRS